MPRPYRLYFVTKGEVKKRRAHNAPTPTYMAVLCRRCDYLVRYFPSVKNWRAISLSEYGLEIAYEGPKDAALMYAVMQSSA